MSHSQAKIHRMFEFVEAIGTVTFSDGPNEAFLAVGMRNYWDGYFAGRAAPRGLAPAEVVDAVFYNFAPGEVARHIPWVWGKITPQEAKEQLAAVIDGMRDRGLVNADGGFTDDGRETRQRIEDLTDQPAAPAYEILSPDELDELIAGLEPIGAALKQADH